MNELQVFDYNNKMIRTIEKNGALWWVLKDVCKILKISKYRDVASRLDDDERELFELDTLGGKQKSIIVNESGLYNVILRSDKPEAKPFRKWVTSEVLPSIRKTGSYSVNETAMPSVMIDMFRDFFQTQQQQFSLLIQNQLAQQETNKQQLTALTNLITSTIQQPYKPPFTRWMDKSFKKVDLIAEAVGTTRKPMLHQLYLELQDSYDIDLNEFQCEYCYSLGIQNTGVYTMNTIGADPELKKLFDLMIDTYIEQYGLSQERVAAAV